MRANVPQFIDVEDKIAGPLTWKQLFWMIGLLVVLVVLYNVLSAGAFIFFGIPISLIFGAFAFIKPYGQPMTSFVFYGAMHLFGPKVYVWKREVRQVAQPQKHKEEIRNKGSDKENVSFDDIRNLARTLDGK